MVEASFLKVEGAAYQYIRKKTKYRKVETFPVEFQEEEVGELL